MSMIGVFWIYQNRVIGKAVCLAEGEERVQYLIDSNINHVDCWNQSLEGINQFPELQGFEYLDIPRGRVLFQKNNGKPLVYLDKQLINEKCKSLISEFFDFDSTEAFWKTDLHYTTSPEGLDKLFNN